MKRARSDSILGAVGKSPSQQQDWQPWAAHQPGLSSKPNSRPSSSARSTGVITPGHPAQQHRSGWSASHAVLPATRPSPLGPSALNILDATERLDPDLMHVPKRRRQAVGRPHAWMIAAHKSVLGSRSASGSPDTSLPLPLDGQHDGSGQASLNSSPSIGHPSWPWDPEPKSEPALVIGHGQPTGPGHALAGSLSADDMKISRESHHDKEPNSALEQGTAAKATAGKNPSRRNDSSPATGSRSPNTHKTQDEDDEDVAVSALWALSANATAENSPELPEGLLQPELAKSGTHSRSQGNKGHDRDHRGKGQGLHPDSLPRIAAQAQARQWLSMATWGQRPTPEMNGGHADEHQLMTHSSKGSAVDASSPHALDAASVPRSNSFSAVGHEVGASKPGPMQPQSLPRAASTGNDHTGSGAGPAQKASSTPPAPVTSPQSADIIQPRQTNVSEHSSDIKVAQDQAGPTGSWPSGNVQAPPSGPQGPGLQPAQSAVKSSHADDCGPALLPHVEELPITPGPPACINLGSDDLQALEKTLLENLGDWQSPADEQLSAKAALLHQMQGMENNSRCSSQEHSQAPLA